MSFDKQEIVFHQLLTAYLTSYDMGDVAAEMERMKIKDVN